VAHSLTGTRIRARRKARKVTQAALAQAAGISPSYLNLIEHNRRKIAGRTLQAIAQELGMSPRALSENPDARFMEALQQAASDNAMPGAEAAQLQEFASRYPGWAGVVETLYLQCQGQRETLASLTDRLNQDPFLRDTTHLFLTTITAIRSTAEILAGMPGMEAEKREQFIQNLHAESLRLSKSATELVSYFDNLSDTPAGPDDSADDETPASSDPSAHSDRVRRIEAGTGVSPDTLKQVAARQHFNPVGIAQELEIDLDDVFVLLAHLPPGPETPLFGIISCDGSGGVRFRKELAGLSLPKYASACPLWPIYRAFGQPGQPIRAIIETPMGERFLTYSCARHTGTADFGLPGLMQSTMIYTGDETLLAEARGNLATDAIPVGLQCAICPRAACTARRARYILDAPEQ
jgi:transcriptional regulator with XRE-family HTH domain